MGLVLMNSPVAAPCHNALCEVGYLEMGRCDGLLVYSTVLELHSANTHHPRAVISTLPVPVAEYRQVDTHLHVATS